MFKYCTILSLILFSIHSLSCKENSFVKENSTYTLNDSEVSLMLGSIPPPTQMQSILSEKEYLYNSNFILKNNTQKCSSTLLLGIYACDIIYTQIFSIKDDALFMYNKMHLISEKLKVENLLDNSKIIECINKSENESLIDQLTIDLEDLNAFYFNQNKPAECLKIQTGEWIESLYLLTKNYQQNPSKELKDRIAEQIVISDVLAKLFIQFEKDPEIKTISLELNPLFDNLNKVKIVEKSIGQKDREALIESGNDSVIPTTESEVIVDNTQFNKLLSSVISARNKLIL